MVGRHDGRKGVRGRDIFLWPLAPRARFMACVYHDRVELGNWTWEKSEAVAAKAPSGPPLIRLDKALVKTTRCVDERHSGVFFGCYWMF